MSCFWWIKIVIIDILLLCYLDIDPMTSAYELDQKVLKMFLRAQNELSRSRLWKVGTLQSELDRETDATDNITTPHLRMVIIDTNKNLELEIHHHWPCTETAVVISEHKTNKLWTTADRLLPTPVLDVSISHATCVVRSADCSRLVHVSKTLAACTSIYVCLSVCVLLCRRRRVALRPVCSVPLHEYLTERARLATPLTASGASKERQPTSIRSSFIIQ